MRLAHVSDPHFGRIASLHVLEDLIEDICAHGCDAILITGDLTQRARRGEFKAAREFLKALPQPYIVVPGNHDMHAWWHRPDLRMLDPLRRYKRQLTKQLEPAIAIQGLAVLGLNTTYGFTVQGGRCTAQQVKRVQSFFSEQPPDTLKVLAVHHPLTALSESENLDLARGGEKLIAAAAEAGVTVVCAGHWHCAHVEVCIAGGSELVVSIAGTATSDRWREPQTEMNSWNLIETGGRNLEVQIRKYDRHTRTFSVYRQVTHSIAEQ